MGRARFLMTFSSLFVLSGVACALPQGPWLRSGLTRQWWIIVEQQMFLPVEIHPEVTPQPGEMPEAFWSRLVPLDRQWLPIETFGTFVEKHIDPKTTLMYVRFLDGDSEERFRRLKGVPSEYVFSMFLEEDTLMEQISNGQSAQFLVDHLPPRPGMTSAEEQEGDGESRVEASDANDSGGGVNPHAE